MKIYITIWWNYENDSWVYIKDIKNLTEMWTILRREYNLSDWGKQDNIVFQIIFHTQSDFKTVTKYKRSIKLKATKYSKLQNVPPSWL